MALDSTGEYRALDVAKWFLLRVDREAGEAMTHLKLQKLVYYAQAWFLANHNKPLFDEEIQAWPHGPVCIAVWHEYKGAGWDALSAPKKAPVFKKAIESFLQKVWITYGEDNAKSLERQTHAEDPWKDARGSLAPEARCTVEITKRSMRDYYRARLDDQRTKNNKK